MSLSTSQIQTKKQEPKRNKEFWEYLLLSTILILFILAMPKCNIIFQTELNNKNTQQIEKEKITVKQTSTTKPIQASNSKLVNVNETPLNVMNPYAIFTLEIDEQTKNLGKSKKQKSPHWSKCAIWYKNQYLIPVIHIPNNYTEIEPLYIKIQSNWIKLSTKKELDISIKKVNTLCSQIKNLLSKQEIIEINPDILKKANCLYPYKSIYKNLLCTP